MAKTTLVVTDKSGKRLGTLFLNVELPTTESHTVFENVSPFFETDNPHPQITNQKQNFWQSDGATYMLAGVFTGSVLLAFSWWYQLGMGALVAASALFVGVGLHVLKIVLHKPPAAPSEPGPKETVIKIEQISDDKQHWLLEQLDESIKMSDLEPVARAVIDSGKWTRAITTRAGLSQGKHQKLQSDFVRLHYLEPLAHGANGYRVTGQGRRFLLQISST